ncbi:hypothetical protein [Sulfitobacter aestuariivivens]|uniref:hypothetical protein n=1 Tax=Sulfitobacter aestuariivivens TaxID=2766981 RepID=UPI00361B8048
MIEEDGFIFNDVTTSTASPGVASGAQAVQSIGNSITFAQADGENFDLEQAVLTAVSGRNIRVQVEAYDDGILVAMDSIRIRDNRDTTINFNDAEFGNVDQIVFTAEGADPG